MIPYKGNSSKSVLFLVIIITILQIDTCFSQNNLEGTVFSAKDSTAISNASVYFDGTSMGTSTNEVGFFNVPFLKNNSLLIISSMGYETVIMDAQDIQLNKLNIYLSEKLEDLQTVFIETDPWSRSRKLALFKQEFLGMNKAAKLCKIINEDSIKLRYAPSSNTLTAYSNEPIIIENRYLGYHLKYTLRDFQIKYRIIYTDSTIPISIKYHGFSFFKPLGKTTSGKVLRNRKKSYLGSTFHIMRSLYSKTLDENDFRIYYNWNLVPTYKYFKIIDSENLKHVELLADKLLIRHKVYEQSLLIAKGPFTIDASGHHAPPESINLRGDMSKRRISELLPLGYQP